LLKDASSPLKHNQKMKLFIGAKEALVRIRVLGLEQINPGESGWIQVESEEPLILVRADRFVLRRPSPGETIGGGLVIDPHPTRRHKRFAKELINRFESLLNGTPEDILLQLIIESGIESYENIAKKARMPEAELQEILSRLLETGAAKQLEDGKVINGKTTIFSSNWETNISQKAESVLGAYHKENRLRIGQPRQELMNKLGLNQKIFQYLLPIWESTGRVKVNYEKQLVALVDFEAVLTTLEKGKIELLEKKLAANPYQTPSVKETIAEIGDSLFHYLLDQNKIKLLSADVYFEERVYEKMLEWVKKEIKINGSVSVVDFRDHFRTSRKYALAFLEHLDSIKITKREGDERVLA
jgi:selenocysteine-specific elongation factor